MELIFKVFLNTPLHYPIFLLFLFYPISMCMGRTDFDVTIQADCKIKIIPEGFLQHRRPAFLYITLQHHRQLFLHNLWCWNTYNKLPGKNVG